MKGDGLLIEQQSGAIGNKNAVLLIQFPLDLRMLQAHGLGVGRTVQGLDPKHTGSGRR